MNEHKKIIELLRSHSNGLDADEIASKLQMEPRETQIQLTKLHHTKGINSSMKKNDGKLSFFQRVYFL